MTTFTTSQINEKARELVEQHVLANVSYLIGTLTKVAANCYTNRDIDLDEDELMNLCVREDYETPAKYFIQNEADLGELEAIADNNGDWNELLLECGVPASAAEKSDMICMDCHIHLQIPEGNEGVSDKRYKELDHYTNAFMEQPKEYMGRPDLDEEFHRPLWGCDCCGSDLAGSYFAYTNMEDFTDDLAERIKSMSALGKEPDEVEKLIRQKVEALVTDESDMSWRDICEWYGLEPDRIEAYEHWICTPWMFERLAEQGQIVGDVCGLKIWGRTCSGQAIWMDWNILDLAREMLELSQPKD